MVTALTGAGMTGSYIFSQTIFSMRAGVKTRIHGIIIAGVACSGMMNNTSCKWLLGKIWLQAPSAEHVLFSVFGNN